MLSFHRMKGNRHFGKLDFHLNEDKNKLQLFPNTKINMETPTFVEMLSCSVLTLFVWSAILDHVGARGCMIVIQRYLLDGKFSNKMAGDSNTETKQVLLATEAELYIEELTNYPLKEIGSPK